MMSIPAQPYQKQGGKTIIGMRLLVLLFLIASCQRLIDDFEAQPGAKPVIKQVGYSLGPVVECAFFQNLIPTGNDTLTVAVKNLTSTPIDSITLFFGVYETNIFQPANLKIAQRVQLKNLPVNKTTSDTILLSDNYNALLNPDLVQVILVSLGADSTNNPFHGFYQGVAELFRDNDAQVHFSSAVSGGTVDYNGECWFSLSGSTGIKIIKGNLHPNGRFTGAVLDSSGGFLSAVQTDTLAPVVLLPGNQLQMDLELSNTSEMELTKRIKVIFLKQG